MSTWDGCSKGWSLVDPVCARATSRGACPEFSFKSMSTQNTLAVCFYARGLKTWGSIMLGASPRIPMARQPHAIPRHCCSRRASRLGAQAIRQCHLLGPQCRCHLSTGRPRLGSCRQTDCILATYEADPKPSEMQTTFEAMQQKGGRCPWVCPSSRWSSADPKLKLRSDTDPLRPHREDANANPGPSKLYCASSSEELPKPFLPTRRPTLPRSACDPKGGPESPAVHAAEKDAQGRYPNRRPCQLQE